MKSVVQFGAGNIGRGFMGQIFTEAGYEVVFVDVADAVVTELNERRSYPLRLVGPDRFEELTIGPVRAVHGKEIDAVAAELAECDFACTAVGVTALPFLVPALVAGLRKRERPLNLLLCENQLHCSDLLRGLLQPHLTDEQLAQVGLIESSVGRMVPVLSAEQRAIDPLLVAAEDYPKLPVDRSAFLGEPPSVAALKAVNHFAAYVERKLYVHNLGHATAAYLGWLAGYEYVHEAMTDAEIRSAAEGAMLESAAALRRKYPLDPEDLRAERDGLLRRFANAALRDTIARVGKDPVRKLRADDRLIGAALNCLDWDVEPVHIVKGIAAALRFAPEDDAAAQAIQAVIREHGLGQALLQFTGQRPDSELGRRVMDAYAAGAESG